MDSEANRVEQIFPNKILCEGQGKKAIYLPPGKITFMKGKQKFRLLFTSKERLLFCLSLGAFVLRFSQVMASE